MPTIVADRLAASEVGRALALTLFHRAYYQGARAWEDSRWLGFTALKAPQDLWVYQEIITSIRPDLIIETGTFAGGSALYLATVCDGLDGGQVISVDIESREDLPEHARIRYLTGSSVEPAMVDQIATLAAGAERVMVILDSDHSREHVLAELRAFGPMVTEGGYLIVEDTNINGHPIAKHWGPGPMEAIDAYFVEGAPFSVDRTREKFLFSCNPKGFLQRRPDS